MESKNNNEIQEYIAEVDLLFQEIYEKEIFYRINKLF